MTINGKDYALKFDNKALFEFGELCGFDTYNETLDVFHEFIEVAKGEPLKLSLADKLGKLCFIALRHGNEGFDLSEREVFNAMAQNPLIMQETLITVLDMMPKPHLEDSLEQEGEGVKKK